MDSAVFSGFGSLGLSIWANLAFVFPGFSLYASNMDGL